MIQPTATFWMNERRQLTRDLEPQIKQMEPCASKASAEAHYDALYLETDHAFGEEGQPQSLVAHLPQHLKCGVVLDLGAGQGRNSLWLAKLGFQVEAVDISQIAVNLMNQIAAAENLPLRAVKSDAREQLRSSYDAVISTYLLHHMNRNDGRRLLAQIRLHTNPSGFNVIACFTTDGALFHHDSRRDLCYLGKGELRTMYRDWDIYEYEESHIASRKKDVHGRPMFNAVAKVLARKPNDLGPTIQVAQ
jgi:tellurite methyltransferase